jgi:hypothetical protein
MRTRRSRRLGIEALAALFFLPVAIAQSPDTVIQTSLLGRVESKRIAVGSSIFVKTVVDWKRGRCRLRDGDTLEAKVVAVEHRTPSSKHERISLRFLPLVCAGNESQEIVPILVAIRGKPHQSDTSMLDRAWLMQAFAASVGSHGMTGALGGHATYVGDGDEASRSMTFSHHSGQASLYVGEVRDFPGVSLKLPDLTLEPTTIQSSHEMLFDPEAQFFLVVRTVASHPSEINVANVPSQLPGTKPSSAPAKPKEPVIVEACVESGCQLADVPALHTGGQVERRLSLRGLGYKVRNNRVLLGLGEDATVDFLGEHQLLVTFDIHPLIERSAEDRAWSTMPRIVRALVVSARDGKVLHAEDWRVDQDGRYLWPLDQGRVLASMGGALAIFGPDLKIERQWALPGPLALVRVSPSRNLIVAAVIKERHTPEEHRRLVEFVGPDRETVAEDYDLTVLDGHLNVIGTRPLHAHPDIPAVLDTGLLVADPEARSRWKIQEIRWNGKQHTIVEERSPCPLRVNALPTNLILLAGCSADAAHPWYKIIRPDGKALLKGTASANGWLEDAEALAARKLLAIGVVEATRPVNFDDGMYAWEFQKLAVSIYSSINGQRLYATGPLKGTANRQSFALNQNGDQLAVLSGEEISLYKTGMSHPGGAHPSGN